MTHNTRTHAAETRESEDTASGAFRTVARKEAARHHVPGKGLAADTAEGPTGARAEG